MILYRLMLNKLTQINIMVRMKLGKRNTKSNSSIFVRNCFWQSTKRLSQSLFAVVLIVQDTHTSYYKHNTKIVFKAD